MRLAPFLFCILPLASCHMLSPGKPGSAAPSSDAPFAPPSAQLVPADEAGRQALWAQVFGAGWPGPDQGQVLKAVFAQDRLAWRAGARPESGFAVKPHPARVGVLVLEEEPAGGAKAGDFTVEARAAAGAPWVPVASGRGIGARKVVRLDKPARVAALRVRFQGAAPALARFSAYVVPARVAIQPEARDFLDSTTVRMACNQPGVAVRYTLDGSAPTKASPSYDLAKPLVIAKTTQVRAAAEEDGVMSPLEDAAKVVAWDRSRLRPATAFVLPPELGLSYACYEGIGSFDALRQAEPVFSGTCAGPVSQARQGGGAQVCEGFFKVEADGLYALAVSAPSAAGPAVRVWVGGDQVLANDGGRMGPAGNGDGGVAQGIVALRAGWHAVRVAWLGDKAPQIKCFGPGCPADGRIAPDRWGR